MALTIFVVVEKESIYMTNLGSSLLAVVVSIVVKVLEYGHSQ